MRPEDVKVGARIRHIRYSKKYTIADICGDCVVLRPDYSKSFSYYSLSPLCVAFELVPDMPVVKTTLSVKPKHNCPRCNGPALLLFTSFECERGCR